MFKNQILLTSESLTMEKPDLNPSLSIMIHIQEGAAFVYWFWLIKITLETAYLVRCPITLPNI